jgi:chromosome segregation ATPase
MAGGTGNGPLVARIAIGVALAMTATLLALVRSDVSGLRDEFFAVREQLVNQNANVAEIREQLSSLATTVRTLAERQLASRPEITALLEKLKLEIEKQTERNASEIMRLRERITNRKGEGDK